MEKKYYFLWYIVGNFEWVYFVVWVVNYSVEFGFFFLYYGVSLVIISNWWVYGIGLCFFCLNWCKSFLYILFYEIVREISVVMNLK